MISWRPWRLGGSLFLLLGGCTTEGDGSGGAGAGGGGVTAGQTGSSASTGEGGSTPASSTSSGAGGGAGGSTGTGGGSGGTGGPTGTRMNWPCASCITSVPSTYDPAVPTPLLVMLHGDEGAPSVVHGFMLQAAMDHGYILLAPACPQDQGCAGPWEDGGWHPGGAAGSIAWLNDQIDAVEADYNVALTRVYLAGGSGGAVYTGYYLDQVAPRIAGAAMVSGGWPALSGTCQACKTPAYILIGDQDFLLSLAEDARDWYQGCGNEVLYDLMPGVDHQGGGESLTTGKGDAILDWFTARPNACLP